MAFHSMKDWATKDYGKNALTAILLGVIVAVAPVPVFVQIIGDVLSLVGVVLLIIWIYRKVKKLP